jgi:ribosomal protein S18 acetylase RimI-like enzyme
MSDVTLTAGSVDIASWSHSVRARRARMYRALGGVTDAGAEALANEVVGQWFKDDDLVPNMTVLVASGAARGTILVIEDVDRGRPSLGVLDLDVELDDGASAALRDALVAVATQRGERRCSILVPGNDDVVRSVARSGDHTLVATRMWLPLPAVTTVDPSVTLTSMSETEYAAFYERLIVNYAADMAAAGGIDLEVARQQSIDQTSSLLTDGRTSPGHHLLTATTASAVGILWLFVGPSAAGTRAFVYDVEVNEGHRGQGLGRAIMEGASEIAARDGAGYIGLNVFGFNDVAISLYRSMGYKVEFEFITLSP